VTDAGVHLDNKVIVRDHAIFSRAHHADKGVDVVIVQSELKSIEPFSQFTATDQTVSILVEKLERFLQAEVLDEEGSRHDVQHFCQSHFPQVYGVESFTHSVDVDFPDCLRIRHPA
jgi:glutaredoxin-related protein